MAINWKKELKSWTKPTKGLVLTPGKAAYHLAKTAVRHPYLTLAGGIALKARGAKGKYAKGLKFNQFGTGGKILSKGGKKFYHG
jgi:hypothetical protein